MGRAKLQISQDFLNSLFYGAKFRYIDARINNWDTDTCIELVIESDKLPENDPSCYLPIITVKPDLVYHAPVNEDFNRLNDKCDENGKFPESKHKWA